MTGVKISALPAANVANDTDQLEVNQGGTSRRLTLGQVLAQVQAGVTNVESGSDLAALAPSDSVVITSCYSTLGDHGGGAWVWNAADQSSRVTNDLQGGLWLAPSSDPTGASGAWQRQFTGPADLRWFGTTVGTTTDQAPIINAAARAVEYNRIGILRGPAGRYRCDTSIKLGLYNSISFEGIGINRSYTTTSSDNEPDDIMLLDFSNAPAATAGVDIGALDQASETGNATRFGVNMKNLTVVREVPQTPGAGGIGIRMKGLIGGQFDEVLVDGFDTGMFLTCNDGAGRACVSLVFTNCSFKESGNYAVHIDSGVELGFYNCDIMGSAIASLYITRTPLDEASSATLYSRACYFNQCVIIGSNQTRTPINSVKIDAGFGHNFTDCAFEGSSEYGMYVSINDPDGNAFDRQAVFIENCWFNAGAGSGCLRCINVSFHAINSRFENALVASDQPCIRVGATVSPLTNRFTSSVVGCDIYYQQSAGILVEGYDGLKISNCTLYALADAVAEPAVLLGATCERNIFSNNIFKTDHTTGWSSTAPIANANVFFNNVCTATSAIADYHYRQANGGTWRTIGTGLDAPRTQYVGTSSSTAGFAWKRYSADASAIHLYYVKSRGTTDGAQGALLNGDDIAMHRYYGSNGTDDIEMCRMLVEIDGTGSPIGSAFDLHLRADGGSLASKFRIDNSGAASFSGAVTSNGFTVGYLDIPQNIRAGNYTTVLADAGKHIYHAVAAAIATYTIPANATVAYPIGTTLSFVNDSANAVTIAITTDTLVLSPGTTTGSRTLSVGGVATAIKVTATRWLVSGTGLT